MSKRRTRGEPSISQRPKRASDDDKDEENMAVGFEKREQCVRDNVEDAESESGNEDAKPDDGKRRSEQPANVVRRDDESAPSEDEASASVSAIMKARKTTTVSYSKCSVSSSSEESTNTLELLSSLLCAGRVTEPIPWFE